MECGRRTWLHTLGLWHMRVLCGANHVLVGGEHGCRAPRRRGSREGKVFGQHSGGRLRLREGMCASVSADLVFRSRPVCALSRVPRAAHQINYEEFVKMMMCVSPRSSPRPTHRLAPACVLPNAGPPYRSFLLRRRRLTLSSVPAHRAK